MTALFPDINTQYCINARDLSMSRGENVLFEGLTASVTSGDVLWVQGNNGIGKTTLLQAFAGLSRPDFGAISWIQEDAETAPKNLIAYQPHQSFAKPTLTTLEDLAFWASIYGVQDLIELTLNSVGLAAKGSVPTQKLSAGQRRRLALAKLIISRKPIWVMDEPSAAMDTDGMALIDSLIEKHINRGGSAIIASHDATRKLSSNTRILTLRASA